MRGAAPMAPPRLRRDVIEALVRGTLTAALVLGALGTPASASAQPRLRWSERWARVDPASYVISSVGVASAFAFDQLYETPDEAHTRGPWLFDRGARGALRADSHQGAEIAATLSDVLLVGLMAWPVLDGLAVAGLGYGSSDVAWQLTSITSEVLAADFILSTLIKAIVHRERPHGEDCSLDDRRSDPDRCGPRGRTRSFYSGHASAAFSSAGTVCMAHANLALYGDLGADASACGGALMTATLVAVLRMLADRHWATDVIVGALIGLATGLGLPYLLHYGWDRSEPTDAPGATAPLRESGAPVQLSVGGRF